MWNIVHNVEYSAWIASLDVSRLRGVKNNPVAVAACIAEQVRARRKVLGYSQEELAERVGIDRTYASQIERAIANPSLQVMCGLADALDCSLIDLLVQRQALESPGAQ